MHNVGLLEAKVNLILKKTDVLMLSNYSMSEQPRPFWIFVAREKNDKKKIAFFEKKAIGSKLPWGVG